LFLPQSKKRKTNVYQKQRPIDKSLIVINKAVADLQVETNLMTVTFPCTVTGIRWDLSCLNDNAAQDTISWAVVLVKDGNQAGIMSNGDGSTFYSPEQNVLTYGIARMHGNANGSGTQHFFEGSTKTMRKLQSGDVLKLIIRGFIAGNKQCVGVFQFFCKS